MFFSISKSSTSVLVVLSGSSPALDLPAVFSMLVLRLCALTSMHLSCRWAGFFCIENPIEGASRKILCRFFSGNVFAFFLAPVTLHFTLPPSSSHPFPSTLWHCLGIWPLCGNRQHHKHSLQSWFVHLSHWAKALRSTRSLLFCHHGLFFFFFIFLAQWSGLDFPRSGTCTHRGEGFVTSESVSLPL